MTPAIKQNLLITVCAALAVVALAGWTRRAVVAPAGSAAAAMNPPAAVRYIPPVNADGTPVVNSPTPLDRANEPDRPSDNLVSRRPFPRQTR